MLRKVGTFLGFAALGAGARQGYNEYRSRKYFGEWEGTVLKAARAGKGGKDEEEEADNKRQQRFMAQVMTSRNELKRSEEADELRDEDFIQDLKETLDSLRKTEVVNIARAFKLEVGDSNKGEAISELIGAVKHTDQPEVLKQLKTLQDVLSLPAERVKEQAQAAGINTEDRDKNELAMSLVFGIKQEAS